jgi:hypothetical protein
MKKKKIDVSFYTGGKPCKPIRNVRFFSKEEMEGMVERLKELREEGKGVTIHKSKRVTEHEYYDFMIEKNIEIENYEECGRLLKLKNETPYSEELTRTISLI